MTHARPRGPLRASPPDEELPQARMRVLRAIGRHEPATTSELAKVLGGHENTTRQHLEALHRDGYVRGAQNRGRMGRPSVSYSLSPAGLAHLAGRASSREHVALVATLSDHLVTTSDDPVGQARLVGTAWGRRLAGRPEDRSDASAAAAASVDDVLDLLASLGFSPVVEDGGAAGPDARGVILRTCPLLDAARERPDVVCSVHEGLVEGFLRARGSEADVAVEPFAAALGCRATISPG